MGNKHSKHVEQSNGMHILKVDGFIEKLRRVRSQIDVPMFASVPLEVLVSTLPHGQLKEESLLILVYILIYRLKSKTADVFLQLVNSNVGVVDTLNSMYLDDTWPQSFNGFNQIPSVIRTENLFLSATVGRITKNRSYQLVSNKASSPIVSLFHVLEWFDETWRRL